MRGPADAYRGPLALFPNHYATNCLGHFWEARVAHFSKASKHGVTPKEFEQAFRSGPIRLYRTQHHREQRYAAVGATAQGRVLLFIYTKRRRRIRAVTAHTAPRKLRKFYAEQKSTKR